MERPASVLGTLLMITTPFAMAACGGTDDPAGPGGNDPPAREILDNPSFATNVAEIFNRRGCTAGNCHGGGQGGLTLGSAAVSYASLVGVAAVGCANETRVIAGDAANSYLLKKLQGTQPGGCGARMPVGGAALDAIDIGNITNWINRGALNN